jgi:outer membrane receptor protein involved in Fe transport
MTRILLLFIVYLISLQLTAGTIEGLVKDARTGELLIGASIYLKNKPAIGTTTGLDGSFVLHNVPESNHILLCSYISYQTQERMVSLTSSHSKLKIELALVSYETELKDVIITASNKSTDSGVRTLERLSPNVLNVVSARSIEISPDLTVANILGRVSGVTLERNSSGEAEYAVLRGMDKRYNITLVNGVKISSPNNKQRFVPLNIFPGELLDRLEVSKSRTANTEGDATGGAVNMVMKDAPSQFTVKAMVSGGYNSQFIQGPFTLFDRKSITNTAPYEAFGKEYSATMSDFGGAMTAPFERQAMPDIAAGVTIGNRFWKKKIGYMVAGTLISTHKGTQSTFFDDEMIQTESTLRLTSMRLREYSEQQTNYGMHAKLDYQISKNNKLEWYNFVVTSDALQVRQSTSTSFKLFYEPEKGNLDLSYQTRLRSTQQQIFASLLQGQHQLSQPLHVNWSLVYSRAGQQRPDQSYVNLDNLQQNFIDNINIDGDGSTRQWEHNSDQDMSISTDISWKHKDLELQAGGLFRYKNRDNFYIRYAFRPLDTNQEFETIDQINWKVYTPKGSVGPMNYEASELIGAGFAQARYQLGKTEAIVGFRTEYTDQRYHMLYPNAGEPADGGQQYPDYLPNIQLKYSPTEQSNWRAGYFRSVNRPGYFELVPYQIQEEEYTEYGNKKLQRTTIDNIDLRWEFFPSPLDQVMIGAFYKKINAPIEFAYFSVNQRQSGYGLQNLGNAQNLGVEFDFIKYIRVMGIKFNYTYTHSAITTSKAYYGKDENGNTRTFTKDQTRPLVGQAAHVANLSLLLKDVKHGWDAQLAASYTGDRIIIASRFLDSDYWEKGSVQLDASVEKRISENWTVFAKASNLLNTPKTEYLKTKNSYNHKFPMQSAADGNTLIRKEYYHTTLLAGVRFRL